MEKEKKKHDENMKWVKLREEAKEEQSFSETCPSTRASYKYNIIALAASPRCFQRQDLSIGVHGHSLFGMLRYTAALLEKEVRGKEKASL